MPIDDDSLLSNHSHRTLNLFFSNTMCSWTNVFLWRMFPHETRCTLNQMHIPLKSDNPDRSKDTFTSK